MGQVHTNQDFVEKANRDSSLLDEQIYTSDEMMEVGGDVDIHDKFIADCAAEARRNQGQSHEEFEKD